MTYDQWKTTEPDPWESEEFCLIHGYEYMCRNKTWQSIATCSECERQAEKEEQEAQTMAELREEIAKIIDGAAFRPQHISGKYLSETEKERWLRARNIALFKADQIGEAFKKAVAEV